MTTNKAQALIESAPVHIREAWLSLSERQRALAIALPAATSKEAAFKAAGYSDSVARKKNQKVPQAIADVAAFIAGAALKSAVLDVQEVLGELAHTVRFDPIDIFDENDCVKPITQWPERAPLRRPAGCSCRSARCGSSTPASSGSCLGRPSWTRRARCRPPSL